MVVWGGALFMDKRLKLLEPNNIFQMKDREEECEPKKSLIFWGSLFAYMYNVCCVCVFFFGFHSDGIDAILRNELSKNKKERIKHRK